MKYCAFCMKEMPNGHIIKCPVCGGSLHVSDIGNECALCGRKNVEVKVESAGDKRLAVIPDSDGPGNDPVTDPGDAEVSETGAAEEISVDPANASIEQDRADDDLGRSRGKTKKSAR
ncbi:MAG: hypothetical protein KQI81_08670 [Deltaproteobacteria bacterium]|nr:hypothetical protein [Deltaproteobacteria bacterium]